MPADVSDTTGSGASANLAAVAERVLDLLLCAECELSVLLVGDAAIRDLNRTWRGIDAPTDVLSFSQLEDEDAGEAHAHPRGARPAGLSRFASGEQLGDIVISIETARRQAEEGGWTLEEELNRLLIHGVLHLLGHEHEHGGPAAARMRSEESRLSGALIAAGVPCACEQL